MDDLIKASTALFGAIISREDSAACVKAALDKLVADDVELEAARSRYLETRSEFERFYSPNDSRPPLSDHD
jgi:hypothetical protein